jgi:cation transport ATPase
LKTSWGQSRGTLPSAPSIPRNRKSAGPESDYRTTIELDVTGVTCGACAGRIERSFNRRDGVVAAGVLDPAACGISMALPSVGVVSNSLRLARVA